MPGKQHGNDLSERLSVGGKILKSASITLILAAAFLALIVPPT